MVANTRELFIKLQAQNAQALRAFDQAERGVAKFQRNSNRRLKLFDKAVAASGRRMSRAFSPVVLGAVAAGFVIATKRAISFADEIGKTADRIGISTKALQEFRLAGELAGVPVAQLDKGLEQFSKRLGEAEADTGSLVEFLKRSDKAFLDNLTSADSVSDALELVIKRMADTGDATKNAALANAAFGRSGIRMTIIARDNAAALTQARAAAQRYGLILDESLIRKAEQANDQLTLVSKALKINFTRALVTLSPTILELGKAFADAAPKIASFFASFAGAEFDTLEGLEQRAGAIQQRMRDIIKEAGFGEVQGGEIVGGSPDASFSDAQKADLKILQAEQQKLTKLIEERIALQDLLAKQAAAAAQARIDEKAAAEAAAAAEKIRETTDALKLEAEQLGLTAQQVAVMNQLRAAGIEISAAAIDAEGRLTGEFSKEAEEIARLTRQIMEANEVTEARLDLESEIKSIQEQVKTELERRLEVEEKLNEAVKKGIILEEERIDTLDRLKKKWKEEDEAKKDNKETTEDLNDEIVDITRTVTDRLSQALDGSARSWRDWARLAVEAIADVIRHIQDLQTAQAGTGAPGSGGQGANLLGTLLGLGASAAGAAGGSGSSIISSTPGPIGGPIGPGALPPSFASGGRVRGAGTGTSDSNLARVSDGEFIVNAKSASRHRALLDRINAAPGFAAGGVVRAPNIDAMARGISNNNTSTTFAPVINIQGANQSPQAIAAAVDQRLQAFAARMNPRGRTPSGQARRDFQSMQVAGRNLT